MCTPRTLALSLGSAVVALGLLAAVCAADGDPKLQAAAQKLADLAAQGKDAELKKQAMTLAKEVDEIGPVMNLMAVRRNGGLGFGKGGGRFDGIEAKILDMLKNPLKPADVAAQSADLERMAHQAAALAEVVRHLCTVDKKMPDKDPKDWAQWSDDMHKAAMELAAAAKAKKDEDVTKAAKKLNKSCSACHSVFK